MTPTQLHSRQSRDSTDAHAYIYIPIAVYVCILPYKALPAVAPSQIIAGNREGLLDHSEQSNVSVANSATSEASVKLKRTVASVTLHG